MALRLALLGVLTGLGPVAPAVAQAPPDAPRVESLPAPKAAVQAPTICEPMVSGFPPGLTVPPQKSPRPAAEIASFVESLSTADATFEVILGEGRLLTLKENLGATGKPRSLVAVGDPSVIEVEIVGPRQLRIIGQRLGATDLAVTTSDGRVYTFEVQVVADLNVLRCHLRALYPDANLKLAQLRDHLVVEGTARDSFQVGHILQTIRAYLISVQATQARKITGQSAVAVPSGTRPVPTPGRPGSGGAEPVPAPVASGVPRPGMAAVPPPAGDVYPEGASQLSVSVAIPEPQIINLIRVPGSQQVLLKVRVAELNRTALREIGADFLGVDPESGAIIGTHIGGAGISGTGTIIGGTLVGTATGSNGPTTTVFGIFQEGDFEVFLRALRLNLIMKTLAEPNLVTMNGQQASFLAGGQFPVPVPQVAASGVAPTVTVQFQDFGVRLSFLPFILDGDIIRLTVDPEVSDIDFTIGTTLVAGGSPVPGLRTRKAHTTVEMRQGQTLAIAGLLQIALNGQTSRIPGLGDLPILGPFFSNTTSNRMEKELVVLVTPYLVEPMNPEQIPPLPGDEYKEPNDLELYFLNRIEGRTGKDFRSTVLYDDPFHLLHHVNLEKKYMAGPCGFSE